MIHKPAPDFDLLDQDNQRHQLSDYRGQWLVLYFYTKDDSLDCTLEACNFRDEYRIIKQFGNAKVIGINHANVASHKAFADKHSLDFPILSDPGHKVTSKYHAWKRVHNMLHGKAYATKKNTFIIDPNGVIVQAYIDIKDPGAHAQQVIEDLQRLQATNQTPAASAQPAAEI